MSREQVFSGWGEPGAGPALPPTADEFLRDGLGVPGGVVSPPVELDAVRLGGEPLGDALRAALADVVGEDGVRTDREIRVLRCRGKSYLDLVAQRAGDCASAPDAVVRPRTQEEAGAVLRVCSEAGAAVVPFGGGTSVVGGLEAAREGFDALISLDLG
ncbi:MAG: alkyldihydroxyacetonephosphate synthase, partial [Solirubrobacteraceae bacterium]|nr:alkyldihydroxyacetonephosphate synthase [Solirubrobacteraceae bacterium]